MLKPYDYWLYPDLYSFEPNERERALQKAKDTQFDGVEFIGIGFALVIVVSITRYSAAALGPLERMLVILLNFLIAIPLLAVFAGPFYVRRVRRGLRDQLRRRSK